MAKPQSKALIRIQGLGFRVQLLFFFGEGGGGVRGGEGGGEGVVFRVQGSGLFLVGFGFRV